MTPVKHVQKELLSLNSALAVLTLLQVTPNVTSVPSVICVLLVLVPHHLVTLVKLVQKVQKLQNNAKAVLTQLWVIPNVISAQLETLVRSELAPQCLVIWEKHALKALKHLNNAQQVITVKTVSLLFALLAFTAKLEPPNAKNALLVIIVQKEALNQRSAQREIPAVMNQSQSKLILVAIEMMKIE